MFERIKMMKHRIRMHRWQKRALLASSMGLALAGGVYAMAPNGGCAGPASFMQHGNPDVMQAHLQSRLKSALQEVGATPEQQTKLMQSASKAFSAMHDMRPDAGQGEALKQLLSAPTLDTAKLEALRAERVKRMDDASRQMSSWITEVAQTLTPEQRVKLMERMLPQRGHFGHHG